MHEPSARMHAFRGRRLTLCTENPPQHSVATVVHSDGKGQEVLIMKRIVGALVVAAATLIPAAAAHGQVGIAVQIGPAPAYYAGYAPSCPGPGYIWTPGYYSGPVWVPGRWVYRAYSGPHYYHPGPYYSRPGRDWEDHDRGHHYGWYKHNDDGGWRR
jgi:hypothetical protein